MNKQNLNRLIENRLVVVKRGGCVGHCEKVKGLRSTDQKHHRFSSQSGHMPGLQARSLEGPPRDNHTLMFLSLSFSLPSPFFKNKFKNFLKKRSTDQQLQNSHGDVKYSLGNIVSNIVITTYGARWALNSSGGTLCKVYDCQTTMLYS